MIFFILNVIMESKEITNCVYTFNVGMNSDVYELIWFKFDVMIDTIRLYI